MSVTAMPAEEIDEILAADREPPDNIEAHVALVAMLREAVHAQSEDLRQSQALWEYEHALAIDALNANRSALRHAEDMLRQRAIHAYETTGDIQPCRGVRVCVESRLRYDPALALEWATDYGVCLALDRDEFEKAAKLALSECAREKLGLDFVTWAPRATATIAGDLRFALAAEP